MLMRNHCCQPHQCFPVDDDDDDDDDAHIIQNIKSSIHGLDKNSVWFHFVRPQPEFLGGYSSAVLT